LKYDAKREATKETFKPRALRPKVNIGCLQFEDEALDRVVGANVIGKKTDSSYSFPIKEVSRRPSCLNSAFIFPNKRNRHITEGSHRTTMSDGQDKSVDWIYWVLTTKFKTVSTTTSSKHYHKSRPPPPLERGERKRSKTGHKVPSG
jgi:hypothetical protein